MSNILNLLNLIVAERQNIQLVIFVQALNDLYLVVIFIQ